MVTVSGFTRSVADIESRSVDVVDVTCHMQILFSCGEVAPLTLMRAARCPKAFDVILELLLDMPDASRSEAHKRRQAPTLDVTVEFRVPDPEPGHALFGADDSRHDLLRTRRLYCGCVRMVAERATRREPLMFETSRCVSASEDGEVDHPRGLRASSG